MSKKSVSDIIKNVPIFPNGESDYITARFEVRNWPILIKAYNIDCDTIGSIEMGYNDGCGGWIWSDYTINCDQMAVLGCANAVAVGMPGWYRIILTDRITGEPKTGLDDILITVTETDMPANMLAQFPGGSATMGCGSHVTIREEDGCFLISVDNVPYSICPGSIVTCDPNGQGLIVDGNLCPFPEQATFSQTDDCLSITIAGQTFTICNSVTIVDALANDQFRATNPDGSIVEWDGGNSVTTVSSLPDDQFQAINPDGSIVTWNGRNSITVASVDTTENKITITNPDGSEVTFWYVEEEPKQTQVTRGTGSQANQNTFTADHKGEYPDVTWRTPWIVRDGDIATIHIWEPSSNSWDNITIDAPENLVVLNNPVIYIRADSGQTNPPINVQADLTVANAFNSFNAVRTFMRRTLVVGTVTLDVRGDFSQPGRRGAEGINSNVFKNAQTINIRGDSDNVRAFILPWGDNDSGRTVGMSTGQATINLRDVTFKALDTALSAERNFACAIDIRDNSHIGLSGKIRLEGMYNNNRPGSPMGTIFRNINSGKVAFNNFMTLEIAMDTGTALLSLIDTSNADCDFGGDVEFINIGSPIEFTGGYIRIRSFGTLWFETGVQAPSALLVSGSTRHVAPNTVSFGPLTAGNTSGVYGGNTSFVNKDWNVDESTGGTQATAIIDNLGVLNNSAGMP